MTSPLDPRHAIQEMKKWKKQMEKHVTGWWFQPSEKCEFVSWGDEIPN
jgi:hypothetical protein